MVTVHVATASTAKAVPPPSTMFEFCDLRVSEYAPLRAFNAESLLSV